MRTKLHIILLVGFILLSTLVGCNRYSDPKSFIEDNEGAVVTAVSPETHFEHQTITVRTKSGDYVTYYGEEITYKVGDTITSE